MKTRISFLFLLCVWAVSCTKEKTDYQAEIETIVPSYDDFEEVLQVDLGHYQIFLESLNGTLYIGYNELRARIMDSRTQQPADGIQKLTFLPILQLENQKSDSGPHQYQLSFQADKGYYTGFSVFPHASDAEREWEIYLGVESSDQYVQEYAEVQVHPQENKNLSMTQFTGNDQQDYYIALISPQVPKVAENELVAGVYKRDSVVPAEDDEFPNPQAYRFSVVDDYTLQLDPRMPEASMGNHSSPGNKDLVQSQDGWYRGLVNYTMTGNWTLNLMMRDQAGNVIKGTPVPDAFTPGVEGVKSELHIDILF